MEYIRNFCIIAHIDHGKSTLADRLLELTGTVEKRIMHDQFLDTLDLEQERGITIKLQTVRMNYNFRNHNYVLNLIDTPGHVDFSYEVSRSLAACEGAILLVDATQGIEAQTISNALKALENNLVILPVINKIDLPNADIKIRKDELKNFFGFRESEIICVSGKTGQGVNELIEAVITRIPSPSGKDNEKLQCLIFDSFFDNHKGVIAQVKLVNGKLTKEDVLSRKKIKLLGADFSLVPIELGYMRPFLCVSESISAGEVGYIATGIKDISKIRVGDTITFLDDQADPLPGYQKAKPMVFASLYPVDNDKQSEFRDSLEKLALNDAALSYTPEFSPALGYGFRCGFLGLLHMEIVQERLEREYGINLIVASPSVEYKAKLISTKIKNLASNNIFEENGDFFIKINSAHDLPDEVYISEIYEPWVLVEIVTPKKFVGNVMQLCQEKRGIYKNTSYLSNLDDEESLLNRVLISYEMPLSEIITDFFDILKSVTHGYASLDYSFGDYKVANVVKLNIFVNSKPIDALATLVDKSKVNQIAKKYVLKLKELIPRHQFRVTIQAGVGSRILAREDIPPYRKDVTKGLSGGDHRRKMKHLERQKEGKKRMKQFGNVNIPQEAFLSLLKK